MRDTDQISAVDGEPMDSPANRVGVAEATFALAVRLSGAVYQGHLDESIYSRPVYIATGGTGVGLPAYPNGTKEDLLSGISNIVTLAISGSALTVDEVLSDVYGPFDPDKPDDMTGIRALINQVRNAFAHRPYQPSWEIRQRHRRIFNVKFSDGSCIDFDARNLDGKRMKPEDFGGLEVWVKLIQHCRRILKVREGSGP